MFGSFGMEAGRSSGAALRRLGFHGVGRSLCGLVILLALPLAAFHGLALLRALDARGAFAALVGALLGMLAADGITGLVHWACDTWGDERTPWVGPSLIRSFREHHREPRAMLEHDWIEVNREPAMAATVALVILSLPGIQRALEGQVFVYGFVCCFIVYAALANQLHCWSHVERPPRFVRVLQRCGLILSPVRHARHHRGACTRAYCISTGWLNPALDRFGFWRALERGIAFATGVQPRTAGRDERVD
jgi:hypothetical protein